jgi:hypothetical protein
MRTKAECLRLIEMVREAGHEPQSAYLVRTRLRRALLGSARFATVVAGANGPAFPGSYAIPEDTSPRATKVLGLCNQIHERTLRLCQPSEAFDARWQREWGNHMADLKKLEEAVSALDA